jgi:hypothetical protein
MAAAHCRTTKCSVFRSSPSCRVTTQVSMAGSSWCSCGAQWDQQHRGRGLVGGCTVTDVGSR